MNILFIIREKIKRLFMKDDKKINDILDTMNDRIAHIEDALVDFRKVLIKIASQGNSIVAFLREMEIEEIDDYTSEKIPSFEDFVKTNTSKNKKVEVTTSSPTSLGKIQEVLETLIEDNKQLKELEKELEKNKDKITPGQFGES
jgi:hypothetical protein